MPPLFPLTLALYAVSCTLFCVAVTQPHTSTIQRVARVALLLAFLSQALDIGWLCLHGQSPAASTREATYFASWLIVAVYLLVALRYPIAMIATLVLPISLVLSVVSRLAPGQAPRAASVLGSLHIFSATLGLALFAVATGAGVIYLITEKQLKRHHLKQLGRRGPALSTLDSLNRGCILLGFPVFTLALVTGAMWIARLPHPPRGNGDADGPLTVLMHYPQYTLSVLSWLIYGSLLTARVTAGMRGRRAAQLTLVGFAFCLGVLGVYFLRGAVTL